MPEKTKSKLNRNHGFSTAEMLAAILILGVVLVAMTSGIRMIGRSYKKFINKSDAISLISTLSTSMNTDLKYASEVNTASDGTVTAFYSSKRGIMMSFVPVTESGQTFMYIHATSNKSGGPESDILVISKSTYTNDLTIYMSEPLTYEKDSDGSGGCFKYKIGIYEKKDTGHNNALIEQGFSVHTLE